MSDERKKEPKIRFKGYTGEWEERKLTELMSFSNGINAQKENYGKGRKMISVMDILDEHPIYYQTIRNSVEVDEKIESKNKVEYGDLIFVRSSEIPDEVGWAKAYLEEEYALYSGFSIRGKKINEFNSYFVELTLNSTNRKQIERKAGGSTRFNVSQTILSSLEINIPNIEEQNKIGKIFSALDDTIALYQRELDLLKQTKQTYLQKMFPKTGEDRPEIRFAGFTEGWEERKLKQLGDIQTGNTPPTDDENNYDETGIPWVTPTDIKSLIIDDTAKKLSRKGISKARIAKTGSILVTSIASIGKNTLVTKDVGFNQQINSLTPTEENDSYFLLTQSIMWSRKMKQSAASGTMQIVNKTEFSNIVTKVPENKEQQKIGSFFKQLDDTITLHQRKLDSLKEMKKSLLQQMFV